MDTGIETCVLTNLRFIDDVCNTSLEGCIGHPRNEGVDMTVLREIPESAEWRKARLSARFIIGASLAQRDAERDARMRRETMAQARRAEVLRRRRVAAGRVPVAQADTGASVSEPSEWDGMPLRAIVALSETGWTSAQYIAGRFDRRVAQLDAERAEWTSMMSEEPTNEGRGQTVTYRTTDDGRTTPMMNGTETRASERWTSTPRRFIRGENGRRLDWRTWTYGNGPRREFIVPVDDETRRVDRVVSAAELQRDRLRAIAASGTSTAHDYNAG